MTQSPERTDMTQIQSSYVRGLDLAYASQRCSLDRRSLHQNAGTSNRVLFMSKSRAAKTDVLGGVLTLTPAGERLGFLTGWEWNTRWELLM